jgi:hypothetical protein
MRSRSFDEGEDFNEENKEQIIEKNENLIRRNSESVLIIDGRELRARRLAYE